ncbi:MAG: carboxymuconolactone decarboxylase family protein [Acidobacteria bacterium]|nr:carboxymuconolactone decarboxylase family protein [Acidobacteriota bacterium]
MARYLPIQKDSVGDRVRELYDRIEKEQGKVLNVFKTMAASAGFLEGFYRMYRSVVGPVSLNERLQTLAILKTSKLDGCPYSLHHHQELAKRAGWSEEQIIAMDAFENSELFSYTEKLVLNWAELVTLRPGEISEELFRTMRSHLTQQQMVELTSIVAFVNMFNRFSRTFRVDIEGKEAAAHAS